MFCPICLPKPKSLGFLRKSSFWLSVVRVVDNWIIEKMKLSFLKVFYLDFESVNNNLLLRKKRYEAYTFFEFVEKE